MKNLTFIYTLNNGQSLYIADPDDPVSTPGVPAIPLSLGPQLFIDPYLLEDENFGISVNVPARGSTSPLLTGTQSGVYRVANFFSSVLTNPFRIWYYALNTATGSLQNAMVKSLDGINWGLPQWIPILGTNEISNVLDEGVDSPQRYKTVIPNTAGATIPLWPGQLWTSADGINWVPGPNLTVPYGEEWSLFHKGADYGILHRWNRVGISWTDSAGVKYTSPSQNAFVRCIAFTGNKNSSTFPASTVVFEPGPRWPGQTQFYYVSNIIKRGVTYIGTMGILRDDLVVSGAPSGAYGTGYTTLVWSIDGVNWNCLDGLHPHFFDPVLGDQSAWDHAMAWITSIVPVVDDVYLYYGGYQWGHKVNTDRQIGMVKVKRDRYVARMGPTSAPVIMRTKLINFNAGSITVNSIGKIRVQVTDSGGVPIPGFSFSDTIPLSGDNLDGVFTNSSLAPLANRDVHLEFELTSANVFAFYLKA